MQFTPKTDTQIARESLREPGTYDFTVVEAEDAKSKKSGADMIKVNLQCFDEHGGHFYLTDYIMEAMAFKLRHFAYGIGAGPDYEAGMLNASAVQGRSGKVKVVIKEDKTGQYQPKNEVKDYVVSEGEVAPVVAPAAAPAPRRATPVAQGASSGDDETNQPPFAICRHLGE